MQDIECPQENADTFRRQMCWKYGKSEDSRKELWVLQHVQHSCQKDKEQKLIVLSRDSGIIDN